jgi:hypothetical protein
VKGTSVSEPQAWSDLWRHAATDDDPADRGLIGEVCTGLELVTDDGPSDPDEVIAMAVAGAHAAEATATGLDNPWALYTPRQAAVVASALFAQIDAAGAALQKLSAYLHTMDARGDVEMPEYDGSEILNLSNAEMVLGWVGDEARAALRDQDDTVRVLAQAPYLGMLPTDAHETVTAVADCLGSAVTLVSEHHCHDQVELQEQYSRGDGCGCYLTLHDSTGAPWQFQRSDTDWVLFPLASVSDSGFAHQASELDTAEALAHPSHLAALIQQHLKLAPRQGPAHA